MKAIVYADSNGHQRRVFIKDNDPEHMAECGVPAGPPDVLDLDMNAILQEINYVLVANELFSWDDVQRARGGLAPAVNVFKRALINLYRQAEKNS